MTFESFFEEAVTLKADAVDMTGYYFESTEPAHLRHLRNLAFRNGLPFTGVASAATLLPSKQDGKAETLGNLKKWVDVTEQLGAPQLRIFTGKSSSEISPSQAMGEVVETMKLAADYAAGKGIILVIENQRGIADTADACIEIMHRVNSPFAGIPLDITHFVPTPTQDNYEQIEACVPFATQTHIRSGKFDDGNPIDLDRILRIFAESGYRGYMSIEYESQTKTAVQIRKDVPQLTDKSNELCRTYSAV
jgi:sugar phosphate isomerase/epimerase